MKDPLTHDSGSLLALLSLSDLSRESRKILSNTEFYIPIFRVYLVPVVSLNLGGGLGGWWSKRCVFKMLFLETTRE